MSRRTIGVNLVQYCILTIFMLYRTTGGTQAHGESRVCVYTLERFKVCRRRRPSSVVCRLSSVVCCPYLLSSHVSTFDTYIYISIQ
jgi:hypothetical protein